MVLGRGDVLEHQIHLVVMIFATHIESVLQLVDRGTLVRNYAVQRERKRVLAHVRIAVRILKHKPVIEIRVRKMVNVVQLMEKIIQAVDQDTFPTLNVRLEVQVIPIFQVKAAPNGGVVQG